MHAYSYKPEYEFVNENKRDRILHMGFELEVDQQEVLQDNDYDSFKLEEEHNVCGKCYTKYDGSLHMGFEIVSHPLTLEWCMTHKEDLKEMFDYVKSKGYNSQGYNRCGYHIHCDKQYLGNSKEEVVTTEAKLVKIFTVLWYDILKLSRRYYTRLGYCRKVNISPRASEGFVRNYVSRMYSRYYAVNTRPQDTCEIRLWRGTLNLDVFLATMDLTQALVNKAKELSWDEITNLTIGEILNGLTYQEHKKVLEDILKAKRLKPEYCKRKYINGK